VAQQMERTQSMGSANVKTKGHVDYNKQSNSNLMSGANLELNGSLINMDETSPTKMDATISKTMNDTTGVGLKPPETYYFSEKDMRNNIDVKRKGG